MAAGAEWAGGQALRAGDAREALASASRCQRDVRGIGGGARGRSAAGMGAARAVPPIRRRFGGAQLLLVRAATTVSGIHNELRISGFVINCNEPKCGTRRITAKK